VSRNVLTQMFLFWLFFSHQSNFTKFGKITSLIKVK
jgi:hypothetical protein